jgi:hypothetical protein
MRQFKEKPVYVQAAQWKGDNDQDMIDLAGSFYRNPYNEAPQYYDVSCALWIPIPIGSWLVRGHTRNLLWLYPDDEFRARFEASTWDPSLAVE